MWSIVIGGKEDTMLLINSSMGYIEVSIKAAKPLWYKNLLNFTCFINQVSRRSTYATKPNLFQLLLQYTTWLHHKSFFNFIDLHQLVTYSLLFYKPDDAIQQSAIHDIPKQIILVQIALPGTRPSWNYKITEFSVHAIWNFTVSPILKGPTFDQREAYA